MPGFADTSAEIIESNASDCISVRFPANKIRSALAILKFVDSLRLSFPNSRRSGDRPRRFYCTIFRCVSLNSRYIFIQ
jgi:hypothetical protein